MMDHRQKLESESLEKRVGSVTKQETTTNSQQFKKKKKTSNHDQVKRRVMRMMKGTAHLYLCHAFAFFYLEVCLC